MRWSYKWRQALRTGQYYVLLERGFLKPEDSEPDIHGFEFYFDAFRELSTCRPGALDLQAIPFTAIIEYSRIYETGDLDEFIYVIRLMDNIFLELSEEEKKRGKSSGSNNRDAKNSN